MDELKEKENILLKNKCHILRMSDNKKKVDMLEAYFSLLQYHKIVSDNDECDLELDIDSEFTRKYDWYTLNETSKKLNELEKNAKLLLEKYQSIIDAYKENDFCLYRYINLIKVNKGKMHKVIYEFFATLGEDVLKIFCDMVNGNNIYLNSSVMERMGYAMDSTPIDNACITVQDIPNYLVFYTTLAHEVGHCYQFYLQKNQRVYSTIDPNCEITSILFEKLFIEYLKNNYMLSDSNSVDLEDHISFLSSVSISKALCKVLIEDKKCLINHFDLSFKSKFKENDLKKEIIDDCGYVKPYDTKPNFVEFHYSFGNIISSYFMEKLKDDFDNGWIEFKNFICTVNYLPMEEVINEYFDIDLIKNNIKKLTKSYRER